MDLEEKISYIQVAGIYEWIQFDVDKVVGWASVLYWVLFMFVRVFGRTETSAA